MNLYERDLPGEYNLKTNFSKDAYKAFLNKLKTDYPELVTIFKNDDYYGYGTWFYEKAFDYYTENEGKINWNNLDKFVQDFLETEGNSFIHILDNVKKKEDKTRDARKTGKVDGKKVWHWDYEDDPDDGTRHQFKADGVNPVDGTYDGVYESTKMNEEYDTDVRDTLYANKLLGLLTKLKRKGYAVDSVVPVSENENDYSAEYNIYFSKSGVGFKLNLDIYEGKHTSYSIKNTDTNEVIENGEGRSFASAISTIDFAGIDSLCESTRILKQQGYRVVLTESTQIDEAINNPDEPASKKQLWALFCITKQDWRDKNLTKGEASELIQKYSGERPQKSAVSAKSLDSKIKEDIMTNLKPKLDKQMAKAFGLQSVVGDADLEGNLIPGGKRYKFFGSGCGWAWVKYDKRNKKLGEILAKYDDIYRHEYFEKFANEYIKKFKEREMGAVLSQDIDIQCIIKQAALDFAESIGINVKGAYVNSRLD